MTSDIISVSSKKQEEFRVFPELFITNIRIFYSKSKKMLKSGIIQLFIPLETFIPYQS